MIIFLKSGVAPLSMKTIYLPATQFHIEVPDNVTYSDDGLVNSLRRHKWDLYMRYHGNYHRNLAEQALDAIDQINTFVARQRGSKYRRGMCFACCSDDAHSLDEAISGNIATHLHTFVLNGEGDVSTTGTRGHEEIHVPLLLNQDEQLEVLMRQEGFICDHFRDLDDEQKAQIGELIALTRKYDIYYFRSADRRPIEAKLRYGLWHISSVSSH